MTDKTIESRGRVGCDYFRLLYSRNSDKYLQYYIDQFNPEDYWIFKATSRIKQVTYKDLLDFKYCQYIFFKKDIYNLEDILKWIDFILKVSKSEFLYLVKPFPPIDIMDKIKVK